MHHARERLFSGKKNWKTTYKKQALFLLEFSVDQFSFNYQTLENVENYLYRRFFIETNREIGQHFFYFLGHLGASNGKIDTKFGIYTND